MKSFSTGFRAIRVLVLSVALCLPLIACAASGTAPSAPPADSSHPVASAPEEIVIAGQVFSPDTTELTAPDGWTKDDLFEALNLLPNLTALHAEQVRLDVETIADLRHRCGDVAFTYTVSLGEQSIPSDARSLDLSLSQPDADVLFDALSVLPNVDAVRLGEWTGALGDLASLKDAYPDIAFTYSFTWLDLMFTSDQTEVSFEGRAIDDVSTLESVLSLLHPNVKADLCGCGLDDATMGRLSDAFPAKKLVWEIDLGFWGTLRTDARAYSTRSRKTDAEMANRMTSEDIAPLKYCTDLIALDLGHQLIEDISCLASLKNLQILILADNRISDLSPLSELTELRYAELFMNRISDLSPLSNLTNLLDLNLCTNRISDLTPLYPLKQLERLWYSNNAYTVEAHEALCKQLPGCNCNRKVWDETADGWREHPRYFWMMEQFEGWPRNLNGKSASASAPRITDVTVDGAIVRLRAEGAAAITDYCFTTKDVVPEPEHPDWRAYSEGVPIYKSDGTYFLRVRDADGTVSDAVPVTVSSGFSYILEAEGLGYLTEPIDDFLTRNGESIDRINTAIAENAVRAGLYSRASVAAAALTFYSRMADLKMALAYQPSGNFTREEDWGVSPEWGTRLGKSESDSQGVYQHAGMNCSTIIVWAYKQAGLNLNGTSRRFCIGDTGYVQRQNDNLAPLDSGDTGDIIATKTGHTILILDRVDGDGDGLSDSYLVLEMESPYLKLKVRDLHSIRLCSLYRMDAFFDGTGAYRKYARYWENTFFIPKEAFPAYYPES